MTEKNTALAVIKKVDQFPALIGDQEQSLAIIKENMGGSLTEFDFARIKVPAGGGTVWEIPRLGGFENEPVIEGIICYWRNVRAYWEEPFDTSGGGTPPDCSSQDCQIGRGSPGGECHACPLSKFESADKGRGQACKEMRLMFVLRPGRNLPAIIAAPPTSLGNARSYFMSLADEGLRYHAVITRFKLIKAKNANTPEFSKIVMEPVAILGPDAAAAAKKYSEFMTAGLEHLVVDAETMQQGSGRSGFDPDPGSAGRSDASHDEEEANPSEE